MLNKKKIKLFFLVCLFFFFLSPGFVFALEINYPQIPGAAPPQDFLQTASPEQILPLYVLYIFNLIIWVSGIIAFGVIVYAGIRYLISAGKPEVIISAKNQISSAFLGILLLLSSFLILRILNPQLAVLEMREPEPIEAVERPETSQPPTESHRSSIDAEIPFGNMIEKRIFSEERMTRIKENSTTTLDLATKLKDSNSTLNSTVISGCSCSNATPVCNGCTSCRSCTCDTCEPVRGTIESIEKDENLPNIEKLRIEQEKTIFEIRDLNIELNRLDAAEALMKACPLSILNSLAEFLDTKRVYLSEKWFFLDIKFLEEAKTVEDWASFYCSVSGTIWGLEQYYTPSEEMMEEPPPLEISEEAQETMACITEVPVGEIIDRTKRVGRLLVKRMEKLVEKDKEMIKAVDEMQVLVSQCTSQLPRCHSVCYIIFFVCVKYCAGTTCPFSEIAEQAEKIAQIQQEIEKLVNQEDGIETIGIIPIIDKVVSKILEDLAKEVRKPMKECIYESSSETAEELPPVLLSNCESAMRAVGPKGKIIENCCLDEPEFQNCLDKCYLEEGQEKYKKCLEDCLREESQNLKNEGKTREGEIIAACRHKINFYCCGK